MMTDIKRRAFIYYTALLGIGIFMGKTMPAKVTSKESKNNERSQNGLSMNGYYGFGETW